MAGYVKFKRWEKEIYNLGYNDGKGNKEPRIIMPKTFTPKIKRNIKDFRKASIINLLKSNQQGLDAYKLMESLKITKGTFYGYIRTLLNENLITKDTTKRPIKFRVQS